MESNLNQTIIIDLFGFPGSGKTTIVKALINEMKIKGYEVQSNIYEINNKKNSFVRSIGKLSNAFSYTLKNFRFIYDLFKSLGEKPFKNINEGIKQWINICFVLTQLNVTDYYDFVVADQGIVQAAISLTINAKDADVNTILNKLKNQIKHRTIYIYITIDIIANLDRLEMRKNGKSRIDYEQSNNKKIDHLLKYEKLFYRIISVNKYLEFDNNRTLIKSESNDFFCNQIRDLIGKISNQISD